MIGAELARHLGERGELVVELDRPVRPARRQGAKPDAINAERAARNAPPNPEGRAETGPARGWAGLGCSQPGAPRCQATTDAPRQLRALVITAPEPERTRFPGLSATVMILMAARLRPTTAAGEIAAFIALSVLRTLAHRSIALTRNAGEPERALTAIFRSWHPDLPDRRGSWSPRGGPRGARHACTPATRIGRPTWSRPSDGPAQRPACHIFPRRVHAGCDPAPLRKNGTVTRCVVTPISGVPSTARPFALASSLLGLVVEVQLQQYNEPGRKRPAWSESSGRAAAVIFGVRPSSSCSTLNTTA